jgi:hypothetical protein
VGRTYERADEAPMLANSKEASGRDPDLGGRGLAVHARIQNIVASAAWSMGFVPLSPRSDDPQFDVAWHDGETLVVGEVKSLTPANAERQLRVATGQILRYAQLIADEPVRPVIIVEREPPDLSWLKLCDEQGIWIAWPGALDRIGLQ